MTAGPEERLPTAGMSFFATSGEVPDWRRVLLYDAAAEAGVLDALPATLDQMSADLGLDAEALRMLLDALAAWTVVEHGVGGRYLPGPTMPDEDETAVIRHHARTVRRWSAQIDDRLRGAPNPDPWRPTSAQLESWMRALAVQARRWAPRAVDACLAVAPAARNVLDLGGGHGEYAREFARRGLRTTVQDRPETIEMLQGQGWLRDSGVELFAGDFFQTVPEETFDIVFCAGVTYTFGGQRNIDLYRNVRSVIAPGGGLAIVTFLRGDGPVPPIFAMQMLIVGAGGDTHGEEQYRGWLEEAGYGSVQVRRAGERPNSLVFATP